MSLANHSDEDLCFFLKKGDERVLQIILDRYWKSMYKMAFNILEDKFICEDVVQNIFIRIWQNRQSLIFSCSLKAYLFASTRYEIYHQVRLKIRKEEKLANLNMDYIDQYNPYVMMEYKQLMERVENLVNGLPERCREVYLLSREEHLSHKEIASQLEISVKTVESQITIALRRLRKGLYRILF